MPKVVIKDVPGLDGEYELDLTFTHRDFRTIKQTAGVRANEVMDAINAGDLDIIVALAEIALQRSGKPHSVEQLWDSEAGSITLDVSADEEVEEETPSSVRARRRAKDERRARIFWDRYERLYGALPGDCDARQLWYPAAGRYLRPSDIDDLTPQQFHAVYEMLESMSKAQKKGR